MDKKLMNKQQILQELEQFLAGSDKPLVVILGPTASGKTNFSLEVGQNYQGEVLSTDSRQIYRQMDLATDVLPLEQRAGIPHHLIGIANPDEVITLTEFTDCAHQIISDIHSRKKLPILAGGTGLYISSIIQNYDVPRVPPNQSLRDQLEKEAAEKGPPHLHQKLTALDPQSAAKIHPNNLRYIIRAIEVATHKPDQPISEAGTGQPQYDTFLIGIHRPRPEIYARIEARVDQQIAEGLLEEVKKLLDQGYDPELPSMTSLGVKEIIPYLQGHYSLDEAKRLLKRNTRRYAKRQCTWLKRYDKVKWLDLSNSNSQS